MTRNISYALPLIFCLSVLYLIAGLRADGEFEIRIPESHPRLAYTAKEIEAWKNDASQSGEIDKIVRKADKILEVGLYVPEQEGNWAFYYKCPKCNAGLKPEKSGKPGSINSHVCPKCGRKYKDEKTVGGYITRLNNLLNKECFDLALAYALTGKKKYSEPVRKAFFKLVDIYPKLQRHDRWGRKGLLAVVGGRRYCQHLTEGIGCMKLAEAYDLIANSLSEEDSKKICDEFLVKTAREILGYNAFGVVGGMNNHQTWFNATYVVIGYATGDRDLVKTGLFGSRGLEWQIEKSITDDGIWYEGTMDYHRYAMSAIVETLDAAKRFGYSLKDSVRLKSLWLGPLQMACPDGSIPATNDSNPSSLAGFKGLYRWGYNYFGDPIFASYAGIATDKGMKIQPESKALESLGMAALRAGKNDGAACAFLDYGIHGGGHGHPDKLNLMLYALGREFLVDPGRISYSVPEFETWCRKTVSHNTVVINGRDQRPDRGQLEFFESKDSYTACLASSARAYPGHILKRFLLLTDGFLVDVFSVHGDKKVKIDWLAHSYGTFETKEKLFEPSAKTGDKNGYQHLEDVMQAQGSQHMTFDFKTGNKFLRMHCLGDGDSTVFTGQGIGTKLKERVPFLLRRRNADSTVVITVYDLTGDGSAVSKIEILSVTSDGREMKGWEASGLKITGKSGSSKTVAVSFKDSETKTSCVGSAFENYLFK